MVVGRFEARAGRPAARRPRRAPARPRRGRSRLADAARPGEQPGVVQACATARRRRTARPRGPGRGSWQQVRDRGEQARGDFLRPCPMRRSAAPAPAPRRRSGGRRFRPRGDSRPGARRCGRRHARRGRGRAPSPSSPSSEHQGPVGQAFADPEGVDRPHRLDAETARAALIGERAVEEAVAQHPAARARAPGGSSCRHGRRGRRRTARPRPRRSSAPRRRSAAARGSLRRPGCRPARGSRPDSRCPRSRSAAASARDLGRLADPLPAFEADEAPARALTPCRTSCLRPIQMRPKKPASLDRLAGDQRHRSAAACRRW